jgi:hypothetical protein
LHYTPLRTLRGHMITTFPITIGEAIIIALLLVIIIRR